MVFKVQDAKVRRFAQHVQKAAVVELATKLTEGLGLVVATGYGRERRQLRAHPRLPDPGAHRAASHSHIFNVAPTVPRALKAESNGFPWNSRSGAPSNELAFFHRGDNPAVGEEGSSGIMGEAGKTQDVHRHPRFLF
jgi:hypothetical protein